MAPKIADGFHRYDLIKLYKKGSSLAALQRLTGADSATIRKFLLRYGVSLRTQAKAAAGANTRRWSKTGWKALPAKRIIHRYTAGESLDSLSGFWNVHPHTIATLLKHHDISVRGIAEQQAI